MDRAGPQPVAAAIADAGEFLDLLEREHAALQAADGERLAQVCRLKAQVLARLGGALALLRQPAPIDPEQRLALRNLVLRCARESAANEALLEARASRGRRALQALHGLPTQYDGRGRSRYGIGGTLRGAA